MKTIKPQKLGILLRPFEAQRQCHLAVSVLVLFPFDAPERLLPETALWKLCAEQLGEGAMIDEGMPKVRGEVLMSGKAFPAGGLARPGVAVRLQLGTVDKRLYVVGDRRWVGGKPTEPVPFSSMPVTWERAFGGPSYPPNPHGRGHAPIRSTDRRAEHPLPNVEDPRHPVASPNDEPAPAGFEAYDFSWPQRFARVGSYDKRWLEQDYPGLACDLDPLLFNSAPEDQWLEGLLRGDETFRIEGMHSAEPVLEGRLPSVVARCWLVREGSEPDALEELGLRIDTVRLFPNAKRGVVVFRGVTHVTEDDAADVRTILLAAERRGEPKPSDHYQRVLGQRLDRKTSFLHVLHDAELLPPEEGAAGPVEPADDDEDLLATENLFAQNLRRRAALQLAATRERLAAEGLDPDAHLPAELPEPAAAEPTVERLPEVMAEADGALAAAQAQATAEQQQAEQQARATCAQAGIDYDELVRAQQASSGGPPRFSADEELQKLRNLDELAHNAGTRLPAIEALLADPRHERKLRDAEAALREMYRRWAHAWPTAAARSADDANELRVRVVAARDGCESLARADLTGADLSGLDLAGVDLREAWLEGADLSSTNLQGADLAGAVLARADLTEARLAGAELSGVNFGDAKLRRADLGGAVDLTGAVLTRADLRGAKLPGACLDDADLSEVVLGDTDLSGLCAARLAVLKVDLSGVKLCGATLRKCIFVECTLDDADFAEATLDGCAFVQCRGARVSFRALTAPSLRVVAGSALPGANFARAQLPGANLRGTALDGADFSDALLDRGDLSECQLQGACLRRASARESLLVRTNLRAADLGGANLMLALLQKAHLEGASFQGANLFRADLARAAGDGQTSFQDALVNRARFVERGAHG